MFLCTIVCFCSGAGHDLIRYKSQLPHFSDLLFPVIFALFLSFTCVRSNHSQINVLLHFRVFCLTLLKISKLSICFTFLLFFSAVHISVQGSRRSGSFFLKSKVSSYAQECSLSIIVSQSCFIKFTVTKGVEKMMQNSFDNE